MTNPFARMLPLVLLALGACREQPPATAFLRQHGGDDFSAFARTYLFVRSIDRRAGEARVFIYKPPATGFALYSYNYALQRSHFLKFASQGNPYSQLASTDNSLVQQFMRLNVTSLEVGPQGTVTAVVQAYSPQIILLKTRDIKTATRPGEKYVAKGGDWYESRRE
ncbi:hypothetical protein [Hymenobacter sp. UYCo722]|uniref:hypothetical protein n=1 Tax=Hymenobacter sp. UYCo722 TaxID=3156335 RepID=UPI00339B8803